MAEAQYDLVVIGGGPGGYVAAIRAAQLGMKVACVEKRKALGGTCLNVGCIPSKALLDSSERYYHLTDKLKKHGITVGSVDLNLADMMKRKDAVVRQLTTGIAGLFKKNKVDHLLGFGKILGQNNGVTQVSVTADDGTTQITNGARVLIATGSEPAELPFLKFDHQSIVDSTDALAFEKIPQHLVVIGGGVIGLELGSVWARLGSKVTVLEYLDRILPGLDLQMAKELQKMLTKQGLEFKLSSKCTGAKVGSSQTTVMAEDMTTKTPFTIDCDKVLVSTGRRPYTAGLGLESVSIQTNKLGQIEIDNHFRTHAPNIYAIGDCVRGAMLAHKAEEEGVAAAEIMAGQKGHVNYDCIPGVVYTHPEYASVGKTEEEVKAGGAAYKVGTFPFIANGRAKAMEEVEGMVKIIADTATDKVLGVHIVGPHAGELIHEAVTVMEYGGSAEDIARTCHAHPTLNEVVKEAALAVDKRQIHM